MKNILFSNVLKRWGTDAVKSTTVKWMKPYTTWGVFHLFNSTGVSACGNHRLLRGEPESKRGFGEEPISGEQYCKVCRNVEQWLTGG